MIDIPEQMYLNAKADILCGADILVRAIKNGIPYETVTEFADRCRECGAKYGKMLKSEPILDKIRDEITEIRDSWEKDNYHDEADALTLALRIIDEYKAEVEPQESEDSKNADSN